ncbi:MAG TPA: RHS repeat-associated core domain-containing protein, partial [Pseudomonas sp.]|uniref:RHS repeat-associated core domain-containing protein n=1 Tax=Pseudomonas sp. TaxID=306 RepID=UPI002EDB74B5
PDLQTPIADPNKLSNYTQTYSYDAGANLLQMRHVGAQSFTRTMKVATDSNRSLPDGDTSLDLTTGFDANGNLQELVRGQSLTWDLRNQLRQVTAVKREQEPDDTEVYVYDGANQRCRKIRSSQTRHRTLISEVRYLPGLELRSEPDGEILDVISVSAGRHAVRILHWQAAKPPEIANDQIRYTLDDHLGSCTLELDQAGKLISQESYYPFGGTAWWAARSAIEAKYKTVRYSGKERDATGLYYYGFRYYAPWLQRWVSPDPTGDMDGLNRYLMVGNSPISHVDYQGSIAVPFDILVTDVVNVMNASIGTGEFEELTWNDNSKSLSSTGTVYTRNMTQLVDATPSWQPSEYGSAAAIFRDADNRLRFFVNEYQQHMGIQPGMGLPLAAGVLKTDVLDPNRLVFENHSGHYKPPSSIDVSGLLNEFSQQAAIRYQSLSEFDTAEQVLRIDSIESPEAYAQLVDKYKTQDKHKFIGYLKNVGIWEQALEQGVSFYSFEVLKTMEPDKTMTAAAAMNLMSGTTVIAVPGPIAPTPGTSTRVKRNAMDPSFVWPSKPPSRSLAKRVSAFFSRSSK